ncbi:hypothetical protein GUJ93_ZPchr0008g13477 [Zizania palustris]|uniref:RING-type E3 ubiquitin transferase n=1 Tax=Zizania palustris TaxID=103762 RepID=A0A8J5VF48_ZIZPA|nr:hypothetical protein GUJ93_ZPchr0008g13477 [Zizania palustris]
MAMVEETAAGGRYWCHMCAVAVSAVAAEGEVEIKCPYCRSGFLEEMQTARSAATAVAGAGGDSTDSSAGSAISIWAPILDSMVGDPVRRRRNRRHADANTDDYRELDLAEFSRSRRRATAFLRLLQAIRERQLQRLESDGGGSFDVEHYSPFGRSLFTAGPGGDQGMALGDYFLGPGLDALMQQLAESDVSRQGTPPAKKEAVDAMPTVEVSGDSSAACAVCLEDYAAGERAREMPCRHRFHAKCIVPWLEMHSSCPVCRFQLPADDNNKGACGSGSHSGHINGNDTVSADDGGADTASNAAGAAAAAAEPDVESGGSASRLPVSIQWLNSLFSQPSSAPASTSGSSSQHRDD